MKWFKRIDLEQELIAMARECDATKDALASLRDFSLFFIYHKNDFAAVMKKLEEGIIYLEIIAPMDNHDGSIYKSTSAFMVHPDGEILKTTLMC